MTHCERDKIKQTISGLEPRNADRRVVFVPNKPLILKNNEPLQKNQCFCNPGS